MQYVKVTQRNDLNMMRTDKEIIEEYREELEIKIKDIFIWALGEEAVTEMTKTVKDNYQMNENYKMNINQLYSLFRLQFKQKRNKFHNRAVFSEYCKNRTKQPTMSGLEYYRQEKIVNLAMLHQPCLLHRSSYH